MIESDQQLDVKGLSCPLPMLKAKKMLAKMSAGQILEIWATDKNIFKDFTDFCEYTGHKLLVCDVVEEDVYHLLVERKIDAV